MAYRKLSDRYGTDLPKTPKGVNSQGSTVVFAEAVLMLTLRKLHLAQRHLYHSISERFCTFALTAARTRRRYLNAVLVA